MVAELLIVLFVLYVVCKGKVETAGAGGCPDEARRRAMDQLREERGRGWD